MNTKSVLTEPVGNAINTLLTAGLGSNQIKVLRLLLDNHHIYIFQDLSKMKQENHISDDDNNQICDISEPMIRSLVNRKLLNIKKVYATVQPDTEHYIMRIKTELVDAVRQACG
jgi:hypothetical protein